jgi:hypothetical protein
MSRELDAVPRGGAMSHGDLVTLTSATRRRQKSSKRTRNRLSVLHCVEFACLTSTRYIGHHDICSRIYRGQQSIAAVPDISTRSLSACIDVRLEMHEQRWHTW